MKNWVESWVLLASPREQRWLTGMRQHNDRLNRSKLSWPPLSRGRPSNPVIHHVPGAWRTEL